MNTKVLNLAEVARRMRKSKSWLHQRLNGNIVNGKVCKFKPDERVEFLEAVSSLWVELGNELRHLRSEDFQKDW